MGGCASKDVPKTVQKALEPYQVPCAARLYQSLDADAAKTQGNAVISAYNIASVFALLAEGASGVALEEVASFFGFKGLQNEMLQTTPLRLAERALRATNKKGAHILISNGIFTGDRVRSEYVKRIATQYSGHVEAVDFRKPEKALKIINQQVQERTKGHIVDLLAEKSITEDTACVLVAVLYFKGTWANPFEARDTLPTNFYVTASDIVSVPMMNKTLPAALFHAPRTLESGQDVHVSYLVLPFMGDEVRFVVEMRTPDPSSPGVDDIHTLLPMDLDAVLHYARHDARQRVDVAVSLPRFRVESTLNLSPVLQQEGVRQIFRPSPDLSKIVDSMPLFVSSAVHKVVVEINESGAEACAAATMSIVSRSFNANFFVADHPFHFHIVSTVAHTILFSGTVRNPLK